MSRIGEEWVRRPHRQVVAPRSPRTRPPSSRVSPPVASSSARSPTAATTSRSSPGVMLSQSRKSAPASTASSASATVVTSTCTGTSGKRRPDPPVGGGDAAGGQLVVVLDHGDVVQAHPLVGAAADPDRVLLQGAQARGGLAGVQHRRLGAGQRVGPGRVWVATPGHPAEQVQRGALGGQQRPGRPGHRGQHVAAGPPGRRRRPRPARRTAAAGPTRHARSNTAAATGSPATTPSARATTSAVSICSAGMVAPLVTSTPSGGEPPRCRGAQVLGQCATYRSARPRPGRARRRRMSTIDCLVRRWFTSYSASAGLVPERRRRRRSRRPGGRATVVGARRKSSRQWQPRVSCRAYAAPAATPRHGEQVRRLPARRCPGRDPGTAQSASAPPVAAQRLGRAQHPGAPGHRLLQRRRGPSASTTQPAPPSGAPGAGSACGGRLPGDVVGDPPGEDQPLQQRVAGQPVRAVHPGAGHLAAGVQAGIEVRPCRSVRTPPEA